MLQPFAEFKSIFIKRLKDSKLRYLVSQNYVRAYDQFADEHKIDILLSPYDDLGAATMHLNAVKADKYAAVLDLENDRHVSKLTDMLAAGSSYRLFFAAVADPKQLKNRLDKFYKEKMMRFINSRTSWRVGGDQTIYPDIDITFGELFIIFKYAGQTLRVKFEEIEKS